MRTALIGHRGVGKTSLLARIETYYRDAGRAVLCLDLDKTIAERTGREISDIFKTEGEEAFRRIERETFSALEKETELFAGDVFLALGAGFDTRVLSPLWKALWVRRTTDESGRIFTDRPRLNPDVHPLVEFKERYDARQEAFAARADEVLWIDEGTDATDPGERAFFIEEYRDLGGAVTVRPWLFRSDKRLSDWLKKRVEWGVRWFELRDDLLSREEMASALKHLPSERVLISFRDPAKEKETAGIVESHRCAYDWPLERGMKSPISRAPDFLSIHARKAGQSLRSVLEELPRDLPPTTRLKAALPVLDFAELIQGHRWYLEQPEQRIFLPCSDNGRWHWYREFLGNRLTLNFFREDEGSSADQPTLLRWIRRRMLENPKNFAAVLGQPVFHSRTPFEHREFFERRNAPVFAIEVSRDEWSDAIQALEELGLRWAAVTSPLKELAYKSCRVSDDLSCRLQAVNTLVRTGESWQGMNTDYEGFVNTWREAVGPVSKATAIWGGGGTLEMMRTKLPQARLYSARTGEPREHYEPAEFSPEVVVWAAGRIADGQPMPPSSWRPEIVFDLSYAEDSTGRAYALQCGARYVSGLAMFRSQAAGQRRFWDACDGTAFQPFSSLRAVRRTTS